LELYAVGFPEPDVMTLAVYGEKGGLPADLAAMYESLARGRGFSVDLYQITLRPIPSKANSRAIPLGGTSGTLQAQRIHVPVNRDETFLRNIKDNSIGIAMEIRGRMCYPRFAPEEGLHLYRHEGKAVRSFVHTANAAMKSYSPPPRIDRKDGMKNYATRRLYDDTRQKIEDVLLKVSPHWSSRNLAAAVGPLLDEHFLSAIRAGLGL
jgi:hypothetical protein